MKFEDLTFAPNAMGMNDRAVVHFDNGYGASVIIGPYTFGGSQGLYELAVLKQNGRRMDICYTTPIAEGVIGHLSKGEVTELLQKIAKLPKIAPIPRLLGKAKGILK